MTVILSVLSTAFGPYTFQAFSLFFTFLQCAVCIVFFTPGLTRREFFLPRVLIALLEGMALCYLLSILYTEVETLLVRVLCYLAVTLLNFGALLFCWKDALSDLLLTFCCGMATYQLTGKLYPLIQNLLGINDKETISFFHAGSGGMTNWDWLLFFVFHLGMYLLLSFLFRPKNHLSHGRYVSWGVGGISVFTVLTINVLICVSRVYEQESWVLNIVVKVFCVAFGLAVLFICSGLLSLSEKDQQLEVLHHLWRQDKIQFESIRDNMDVINMKCHDLKHILDKIEGKLTSEEISSLREAIQFYDANIKTGNEVLDVVLCEKAMTCQKNGITFSCLADGTKLTFLTPVQTYTLFGNIIDNAIEAVKQLSSPEDKIISLICRETSQGLEIEESNYFSGELQLAGGLPVTVKEDRSHHGFGTKSIQYIAEQYGGALDIHILDNMFFLKVRFPFNSRTSCRSERAARP